MRMTQGVKVASAVCGMLLLIAPVGCVRRTLTVRTEPDGARVFLNDQEVGTSPVSVDFLWYGDYDVIIRKQGYETLKTHHKIDPPWYQIPPMDFVAEILVPFEIHDEREVAFTLQPAEEIDPEALLQDALELREQALYGHD